jgi:hypothetical protein
MLYKFEKIYAGDFRYGGKKCMALLKKVDMADSYIFQAKLYSRSLFVILYLFFVVGKLAT